MAADARLVALFRMGQKRTFPSILCSTGSGQHEATSSVSLLAGHLLPALMRKAKLMGLLTQIHALLTGSLLQLVAYPCGELDAGNTLTLFFTLRSLAG